MGKWSHQVEGDLRRAGRVHVLIAPEKNPPKEIKLTGDKGDG